MTLPSPIAVVGCGLIGGSLLKALHGQGVRVVAVDSDDRTRESIRVQLGVEVNASLDAIASAHVVVLATPVRVLLQQLSSIAEALRSAPSAVVTDVAGIKAPVLAAMKAHLTGVAAFVGGHPMAGKERGSFAESDAALFRGKPVALCGTPNALVEEMWRSTGARTLYCEADAHDAAVARVSHLPHLVAAALAAVGGRGDSLSDQLASSGFRDTTRVAEDPTIREALVCNPHVATLARNAAAELLKYAEALEAGRPIDTELDAAAAVRRRIVRGQSVT